MRMCNNKVNQLFKHAEFFSSCIFYLYFMLKRLLTILAILSVSLCVCPANYIINNLIADSVVFSVDTNSSISTMRFNYGFQSSFDNAPSIGLALQDFSINHLSAHSVSIQPATIKNTGVVFQFDYTSLVWSKVRINFLASNNKQIQVGTFKIDNVKVSNGQAQGHTTIAQAFDLNAKPVIRIFLNGWNVTTSSLGLSVSPNNLVGTKLTINITTLASTNLLSAWFSYIAFSPSAASFGSYGGSYSQQSFQGFSSKDISRTLYQTPYVLYGLFDIKLSGSQFIVFNSKIDSDFMLSISSSRSLDQFGLLYIAIGVQPASICSSCGKQNMAYKANCVSQCPNGTYAFTYNDKGVACRTCSVGQVLSNGKCVAASSNGGITTSEITTNTTDEIASNGNNGSFTVTIPLLASTESSASAISLSSTSNDVILTILQPISKPSPPICPPNAFYNQNECVCIVGYAYIFGRCQQLRIASSTPIVINYPSFNNQTQTTTQTTTSIGSNSVYIVIANLCHGQNQVHDGRQCICVAGGIIINQICTLSTPYTNPPIIVCPTGFIKLKDQCVDISNGVQCQANSFGNGLGSCVCNQGYYLSGTVCVKGVPCQSNSTMQADGTCKCNAGLTNYNGFCSKCPAGALWSSASNQCIFVCGQNAIYSPSASQCICNTGFGIIGGVCSQCPLNFFINNGYCVTCPIFSRYNAATKNCDCQDGYYTNQNGICLKKCGSNEAYDVNAQQCLCVSGLGRINGVCQVCPTGSSPTTGGASCNFCQANTVLVNGLCICQTGNALNSVGICTICSSIPGAFLINEVCSVCPGNLVYDGVSSCRCSAGKIAQGSQCVSQCQSDELLDSQGNCFTCKNNEVISKGKCNCLSGFTRGLCGNCLLSCNSNQFSFQGTCATCPLNTIYNPNINGCTCPSSYYMDSYGVCQKLVLQPVNCNNGQYFDSSSGCVSCGSSCGTCKSANQCLTCLQSEYVINSQGQCVRPPTQINPLNTTTPVTPITPTTPTTPSIPVINNTQAAGLYQSGKSSINSNNVFITLKTNPTFTFANPVQMQNFITATFNGASPTTYCAQRNSPNLDTFDCLLIYPSGIPNKAFNVSFSYNYQNRQGSFTVNVDPLATSNSRRH